MADADRLAGDYRNSIGPAALADPKGTAERIVREHYDAGDCAYTELHRYTESSARAKLARHRNRGDTNLMIAGCPGHDHWHVVGQVSPDSERCE